MAKWAVAIGFGSAALWLVPAAAETSSDLVFCSRLTNSRERIACYDAAARIADRAPRPRTSTATTVISSPVLKSDTAPVVTVAPSRFDGLYAAAGGSFGFTTPRGFAIGGGDESKGFLSGSVYPSGWSGTGVLGYNVTYGALLAGIELSGRYGSEKAERSGVTDFSFGGVTGTANMSYGFNNEASIHATGRLGLVVDNSLVFAKFGAGGAYIVQNGNQTGSGARCTFGVTVFPPGSQFCITQSAITSATSTHEVWMPSVLFGVGAERNFGPWFARVDGEVQAVSGLQDFRNTSPSLFTQSFSTETFWAARIVGMAGLRF